MPNSVLSRFVLRTVVDRASSVAYIEFPSDEPMVNVIAAVQSAERDHGLAFDLLDEGLWEHRRAGVRLHGMFKEQMI